MCLRAYSNQPQYAWSPLWAPTPAHPQPRFSGHLPQALLSKRPSQWVLISLVNTSLRCWLCSCLISSPLGSHSPNQPVSLAVLRGCSSLPVLFSFLHPSSSLVSFDLVLLTHTHISKGRLILKRLYKVTCVCVSKACLPSKARSPKGIASSRWLSSEPSLVPRTPLQLSLPPGAQSTVLYQLGC